MYYDIIGDIHGQADKLEDLLLELGYAMTNGVYRHNDRKAVYVGDFIDGGTQNRRVIEIVRNMVTTRHAYAVMGNHEYNAICYHTPKSGIDWLRPHTKNKFKQHESFLAEYPIGYPDTQDVIEWFKTLPLFIDCEELHFRVIHACWDQRKIDYAKEHYLNHNNVMSGRKLEQSAIEDDDPYSLFNIIERLLKGVEVGLPQKPEKIRFLDKDKFERSRIRAKWWGSTDASYREIAFGYNQQTLALFPDDQRPDNSEIPFYNKDEVKPVFFGHYWMRGDPELQQENVCCVDYSAGVGGELVCYSIENPGEGGKLNVANFTST